MLSLCVACYLLFRCRLLFVMCRSWLFDVVWRLLVDVYCCVCVVCCVLLVVRCASFAVCCVLLYVCAAVRGSLWVACCCLAVCLLFTERVVV